ncbi:MAG: HK97 family phage prohead protease, partial [Chloroflexi bacterium]|nr:HK97 family phage prohead protease [Chloroflexota bacterium]
VLREDGRLVRIEGSFFLDTPHGDAAFRTVRNLGKLAEWSYVFRVLDHSFGTWPVGAGRNQPVRFLKALDVISVEPVARGAGIGTRTERIKAAHGIDVERESLRFYRTIARQYGAA